MIKKRNIAAALGVLAGTGALAMPMPTNAASNAITADVSVTVGSYIELSIVTGDKITVSMIAGEDRALETDKTQLKINTNNGGGYKIEAQDNATGGIGNLKNGAAFIAPMTDGNSAPSGKSGKWGIKVDGLWYGISGSPKQIATYSNLERTTVDVNYGFSTTTTQAAGEYTGTIKFIATTNN